MPSADPSERKAIHVGNVIQNAIIFNFRKHHGNMMNANSLLQSVEQLFSLLHTRDIEYLLVDDIAMLQYVQRRNTEDIDLILSTSSLQTLPEITITSQDNNFARGRFENLQIDFLLTRNPLFAKVQHHYATIQSFQTSDIPCATDEGLVLLKLYALPSLYRQGNFARVGLYENDIATLMHDYQPNMEALFTELTLHLSDSDIASLV
ncbi:MAG: hypothetical protein ETSY2_18610, partial [Candidatus Entotheonella gemina]